LFLDEFLSSPGSYISMPTPHQGPIFHDTYRSPIQTSPTTSIPEMSSYCHSTSNPSHHGNYCSFSFWFEIVSF